MAKWYETPDEERTPEQKRLAQRAYYRTLLESDDGRQVLFDMMRRVDASNAVVAKDSEFAMAQLWLAGFLDKTIKLCGVTDWMALIKAQERIAKRYEAKQEKPDLPEGFEE